MLAIIGTVPDQNLPIVSGKIRLEDNWICIQDTKVFVNRGTPALLAAAVKTCEVLDKTAPFGYLVGDIGKGDGSRRLYEYLTRHFGKDDLRSETGTAFNTIAFHYLQPDVDWHNRVLLAVLDMAQRPVLIADAGFMYAAKMSGQASEYDLFTPDVGELAFLADEEAPHPFYTRGFILHEENRVPELIARTYEHNNAPRYLLVKGEQDYIVNGDGFIEIVNQPSFDAMEAIGGTGDSLTGLATVLCSSGYTVEEGAVLAARTNRWTGYFSNPSPSTQVSDLIEKIPHALSRVLNDQKKGG